MTKSICLLPLLLSLLSPLWAAEIVSPLDEWAVMPRIAYSGTEYLVVWYQTSTYQIVAARYDSLLNRLGDSIPISPPAFPHPGAMAVASDGSRFLVVYEYSQPYTGIFVYGTFVDPGGQAGPPFMIGYVQSECPTVASNGDAFLVAWHGIDSSRIESRLVYRDSMGHIETLVPGGDLPSLASDGDRFFLTCLAGPAPDSILGLGLESSPGHERYTIYRDFSDGQPVVTYDAAQDAFLVAFRSKDSTPATRICGLEATLGDIVEVPQDLAGDSLDVTAGGVNNLLTWQPSVGGNVLGQRLNHPGQLVGPQEEVYSLAPGHDPHAASDGYRFAVVWQQVDDTSSVIYIDTFPAYQRHFYSRAEFATAFNQSQHIARDPETGELHVVYATKGHEPVTDSILYTHSTNSGEDWFPYEYVGDGSFPAVVDNWVCGVGLGAWVAYVGADGSIVRAIRHGESDWTYDTVFEGQPSGLYAGPPSLASAYITPYPPAAYVVYPVQNGPYREVHFNLFTEGLVEPESVLFTSQTADFPCIARTPGDIIHVSWQHGEEHERAIYYRVYQNGAWSDTARVSTPAPQEPTSEPAAHASLEAYADFVYCVWRGPADPGDVWRGSRWLQNPPQQWYDPDTQNCTADRESDYPVMTTEYVSVWHEQVGVGGNYDIWARYVDRTAPDPLFETELRSWFPHVTSYCEAEPPHRFHCQTVWTEETDIPERFEVMFGDTVPPSAFAEGHEPGSFYSVEVGGPKPSPYCTQRGGFREYQSFRADTSAGELTYVLPYLNPRCTYLLRAVLYHEGKETWAAELRGDSSPWAKVTARPNVPETVWVRIPREAYRKDTRVEFNLRRVTGGFVSLAGLKLFQREFRDKGYELAVVGGRAPSVRSFQATPNPFATHTSICYSLAAPGRARVDILDAAGRVVCKLVDTELPAGEHRAAWSGRDEQGRAVAAGVYFCRLLTPDAAAIDRVVLLR